MSAFNYGLSQIQKLDPDDDWQFKIVSSNYENSERTGETHWMRLNENQKRIIAGLIFEFNADNSK